VFAKNGNPALNGGVTDDFDYNNVYAFNNTADSIVLDNGPLEIDRVVWNALWPKPVGRSIELDRALYKGDNNVPESWCEADDPLSGGDFGSPGADNDFCP
jgi:hypothetical protein